MYTSHHHLKAVASGRPIVIAPILLYSDDTSGNRSKKWNKFDVWCISLAGIPKDAIHESSNIYFVACSNRTSANEMTGPIVDELIKLENGIQVWHH